MNDSSLNVQGINCSAVSAGIKKTNDLDLSIISMIEGTSTAAVFTQNVFCAAPVLVAKNHLQNSPKAMLINSGNANAGTGKEGIVNTLKSCEILADKLNIKAEEIMPFSTGVIGMQLDLSSFERAIPMAVSQLDLESMKNVSKAILTTDLVEKNCTKTFKFSGKVVTLCGVAKGSGMIRPDMATMLSFIFTDIGASQEALQECLTIAVNQSFNRITVDGDTSTNDACTLSATNQSDVNLDECKDEFQNTLNELTRTLAHMIVKDGEGATKFVEVKVGGLASNEDCLEVAYTVAHSPLVKTALFASDANWGRILAAVGRSKVEGISIENIDIYLNELQIIASGEPSLDYSESLGSAEMLKSDITIRIDLGDAPSSESVWTTDLSYDYVKINAEYRS
ncbi:MAG: bifunctional glutamate N-acetyltransferase/amino-acid acetyltransferase ArgJ [Candidatus Thioglobus sp.]|nr:bifunctional glutamate N-acetyltransferase/amino-acid acetyltransferase ArgJ [Candidatus Pseudothioglobus aerophilus]MDP0560292.1 bifunctional glutamate N-acetyltransferase/amino-acid acetyltransferase ArgJ [Candidatus Thioglobus sp.]